MGRTSASSASRASRTSRAPRTSRASRTSTASSDGAKPAEPEQRESGYVGVDGQRSRGASDDEETPEVSTRARRNQSEGDNAVPGARNHSVPPPSTEPSDAQAAPPPAASAYDLDQLPESSGVFAPNPALEASELYAREGSIVKRGRRYYAHWSPSYWGAMEEDHDAKSHITGDQVLESTIENGVVRVILRP
jgi:hypothetical protein